MAVCEMIETKPGASVKMEVCIMKEYSSWWKESLPVKLNGAHVLDEEVMVKDKEIP